MLSIEKLRENSLSQSFEKGEQLHAGGAVRSLLRSGKLFSAEVQGSYRYQLTIDFSQNPTYTACSCPFSSSGWCKHLVAAGIAIIGNEAVHNEEIGDEEEESFFEDVYLKTDEQVREGFLRQLFEQREDMQRAFRLFVEPPRVVSFKQVVNMRRLLSDKVDALVGNDLARCKKLIKKQEQILVEVISQNQYYFRRLFNENYHRIEDTATDPNPLPAIAGMVGTIEFLESRRSQFGDSWVLYHSFFLEEYWDTLQGHVAQTVLPSGISRSAIELIIDRWSFLRASNDEGAFSMNNFSRLLKLLVIDEIAARYLLFRMEAFVVEISRESPDLLLYAAEKAGDEKAFWRHANHLWKKDARAAKLFLLAFKDQKGNEDDFIEKAKEALDVFGEKISHFLFTIIEREKAPDLHQELLRIRASTEASATLYQQWREHASEAERDDFIQKQAEHAFFYLRLLTIEQKHELIRNLAHSQTPEQLRYYIRPIMEVYPDFCFEKIKEELSKLLAKPSDRTTYRLATDLLNLAREIPGYLEKANALHRKYDKLDWPALSEEINKPGLGS